MMARDATYPDLADIIAARFLESARTVRELFARIVFNIAIRNTDDHARNDPAFCDGLNLSMTPAYDPCPQNRSGTEVTQAMRITRSGDRHSRFRTCLDSAYDFALTRAEETTVIDHQIEVIPSGWDDAAGRRPPHRRRTRPATGAAGPQRIRVRDY